MWMLGKMKLIIDHYGKQNQYRQAQEELAELIVAINKYLRYGSSVTQENLIEEIADVEVTLAEMKLMLELSDFDIDYIKMAKIDRQLERIHNDIQGKPDACEKKE